MKFTDGSVRLGYNGVPWSFSTSRSDRYFIEADPLRRPLLPFKDELARAAREIAAYYPGEEVGVLYSGGMDSEAVLLALHQAGVPVRALSIHFPGINEAELSCVAPFLNSLGIKGDRVVWDLPGWFASSASKDLGKRIQASSSAATAVWGAVQEYWARKIIFYTALDLELHDTSRGWMIIEGEYNTYTPYKALMALGLRGTGSLFAWSTEVMNSWLVDPFWNAFRAGQWRGVVQKGSQLKAFFYEHALGLRRRPKLDYLRVKIPGSWVDYSSPCMRQFRCPADQWFSHCGVPS